MTRADSGSRQVDAYPCLNKADGLLGLPNRPAGYFCRPTVAKFDSATPDGTTRCCSRATEGW